MQPALSTLDTTIRFLGQTAFGEASGEGEDGMQAVINTAQNRVALQTWMGKTLIQACLKPAQYSVWNKPTPSCPNPDYDRTRNVTLDDPTFQTAVRLATLAVAGNLPDITDGATSYYREGTPVPVWIGPIKFGPNKGKAAVFTRQIGHHLFFKDVP